METTLNRAVASSALLVSVRSNSHNAPLVKLGRLGSGRKNL